MSPMSIKNFQCCFVKILDIKIMPKTAGMERKISEYAMKRCGISLVSPSGLPRKAVSVIAAEDNTKHSLSGPLSHLDNTAKITIMERK